MKIRSLSLSGTFALFSLIIIGAITTLQMTVQWTLLREDLLEWERTVSAEIVRTEVYALLRGEDFVNWRSPESQERFERAFRRALGKLEILRIRVHDPEMRVIWSDEAQAPGTRAPGNPRLAQALAGQTVAGLERARLAGDPSAGRFEDIVELYVPLFLSPGATPGTARLAGVVEIHKNPSSALANLSRDRWTIVGASLLGALVLYASLFGLVHRASRQLRRQREDLERQAATLAATNQELRAAQQQLRAAERLAAIGEVSAAVAHGIRNPLAVIRMSAQLAGVRAADDLPATRNHLDAIVSEVDRLGGWIRALLEAARPFELRPVSVDLNAMVEDLLRLMSERAARGHVVVERQLASDLPRLAVDEVHFQQALLGLFENALEAMPDGGRLVVRTERAGEGAEPGARIVIGDTGEGIPEERLAKIFDLFFTTKPGGTGLGLAVTRRVIEGHGGAITVASKPGAGTTFVITVPVGSKA
jgi:signal transduction histidine kinase